MRGAGESSPVYGELEDGSVGLGRGEIHLPSQVLLAKEFHGIGAKSSSIFLFGAEIALKDPFGDSIRDSLLVPNSERHFTGSLFSRHPDFIAFVGGFQGVHDHVIENALEQRKIGGECQVRGWIKEN